MTVFDQFIFILIFKRIHRSFIAAPAQLTDLAFDPLLCCYRFFPRKSRRLYTQKNTIIVPIGFRAHHRHLRPLSILKSASQAVAKEESICKANLQYVYVFLNVKGALQYDV